jgi:hypothetical protein
VSASTATAQQSNLIDQDPGAETQAAHDKAASGRPRARDKQMFLFRF